MNYVAAFYAALRALATQRPVERKVRVNQSKVLNALSSHEIYRKGDMRVLENEWRESVEVWKRNDSN